MKPWEQSLGIYFRNVSFNDITISQRHGRHTYSILPLLRRLLISCARQDTAENVLARTARPCTRSQRARLRMAPARCVVMSSIMSCLGLRLAVTLSSCATGLSHWSKLCTDFKTVFDEPQYYRWRTETRARARHDENASLCMKMGYTRTY